MIPIQLTLNEYCHVLDTGNGQDTSPALLRVVRSSHGKKITVQGMQLHGRDIGHVRQMYREECHSLWSRSKGFLRKVAFSRSAISET